MNKFLPHYLPSGESYLQELPIIQEPKQSDYNVHGYDFNEHTMYNDHVSLYKQHLASLRRISAPFLTPAHTSEMIEGVDFEIVHEFFVGKWVRISISIVDVLRERLPDQFREVAVPIPQAEKDRN